jgi:hypothetical protein
MELKTFLATLKVLVALAAHPGFALAAIVALVIFAVGAGRQVEFRISGK